MTFSLHRSRRGAVSLALLFSPLLLAACGSSSSSTGEDAGTGGVAGTGAAGKAGSSGTGGAGGAAGSSAGGGGTTAGGAAGKAGGAGTAGKAGAAGSSGAGAAGSSGVGGSGGAAGTTGGAGGSSGTGSGGAGAAGATGGCDGLPGLGESCATGLAGVCSVGHNKCIQGAVSCVPDVGPGEKPEICDGLDNDCDGETDEGLPKNTYFVDADADGFGSTATVQACALGPGLSDKGNDCNDNNKAIYPGAEEVCNDVDDNCDGSVDEGVKKTTYYVDSDKDGYGSTATQQACALTPGLSEFSTDCNDSNLNIHPGAVEICNDADDNCNGLVDEGVQKPTFYLDSDGDGFGGIASKFACTAPAGYVETPGDCNDFNKNIYPGAPEQCNNIDDDCNGLVDDNVALLTIYKDNDGDGFAAASALSQKKCDIPVGFTVAKDVDGDGQPDWDCNDSQVKVYPGAPEVCGDGLDNSCSGYIDRLCFTPCGGSWPYKLPNSYDGLDYSTIADLDGDGSGEVITQENFGFAILDKNGKPLHQYSAPVHNYSRNRIVLADIDTYDQFTDAIQNVEVLSANGSIPQYYRLNGDKSVTVFNQHDLGPGVPVYDASTFMATDFDRDGVPEFVSATWCEANATKILRFDRASGTIKLAGTVADPEGKCQYANGRSLTDLDGDGVPELIHGNGYTYPTDPNYWSGHTFATRFTSPTSLTNSLYCPAGSCFNTDLPGHYGGGIATLFRFGDEVRFFSFEFTSNQPNVSNPYDLAFWRFDPAGKLIAESTTTNTLYQDNTDIDDDGKPESVGEVAQLGLYDVNGDNRADLIYSTGQQLQVGLWDNQKHSFSPHTPSAFKVATGNVNVHAVGDINNDGRADVITADGDGNLYCHSLGPDTWNRYNNLPPHFPAYLRTNQWDNYEPNEGVDTSGDGIPDQVIRLPSAVTAKGDFYSYLASPTDKDYYLVDAAYNAKICLRAPAGRSYRLKVYSYADLWNNTSQAAGADGKPDGLIWQDGSDAQTKCFYSTSVVPPRYGEHKFVVGIESVSGSSPYRPYWLQVEK